MMPATAEDAPLKSRAQVLAERQKLYPELTRMVEAAHGVAPEFAAEALLRVSEAPFLIDRDWRKELIDEAFEQARHAKEPAPQRSAVSAGMPGTRAGMSAQAAAIGLDRLTLTMRAVRDQLGLDLLRARELFASAGRPVPRHASCEDVLVDNVSAYFETLAQVVNAGFTTAEKQKGANVQLLSAEVRKIVSAVEVGPAARAIAMSRLSAPQLETALAALASALSKISGDDRSFSATIAGTEIDMTALLEKARSAGISPEGLAGAYRQYVVQNLSGPRCEDTVGTKPDMGAGIGGGAAVERTPSTWAGVDPSTIKPSKVEGKPKLEPFLSSEQGDTFRSAFTALMFGGGSRQLRDEEKGTAAWREKFAALGKTIEEMKRESNEPASDFFYRKAGAYLVAVTAAPPGPDRDRIVGQYIAYLRTSDMQQENVLGWFAQVDALSNLTQSLNSDEYRKLLLALANSGHPVLRLYAEEQTALPQRPSWAMPSNRD